jgi:putative transposase
MPYDPNKHHQRSIRLQGYDYSRQGAYFVTLCTTNRECLFGEIVDGKLMLNEYGQIVNEEWLNTALVRPSVELDEYVVMPNHLHGIIVLTDTDRVGATRRVAPSAYPPKGPITGSIGAIIAQFKAVSTKRINRLRSVRGVRVWQRNYFEHIIRNERSLNQIREYIQNNPLLWADDLENPVNLRNVQSGGSSPQRDT